jgi:hypothetical protein
VVALSNLRAKLTLKVQQLSLYKVPLGKREGREGLNFPERCLREGKQNF